MLKLSLSSDELLANKKQMLKNIVMSYYSMLQQKVIQEEVEIDKVDYPFMNLLNRKINPVDIFINDNFFSFILSTLYDMLITFGSFFINCLLYNLNNNFYQV